MFIDFLLSNFEVILLFSVILIVVSFFLLFFLQNQNFSQNKNSIIECVNKINSANKEIKEYLIGIGNILDQQSNHISRVSEKTAFIEKEINRIVSIKGSEDMLNVAIEMSKKGEDRETIKNKTGLRDDEIEAIYTYYKKTI